MSLEYPNTDPRGIADVKLLQELVIKLLNEVADVRDQLGASQKELQEARDEINRLKKEQGQPRFGKRKGKVDKLAKRVGTKTNKSTKPSYKGGPKIDRTVRLEKRPDNLPADAEFKGWRSVVERNIRIVPDTVKYLISRWYSPSTGKVYESSLPDSYRGQVGNELVSLIQILHHCGNMTHGSIKQILEHLKMDLSKGCISNILTKNNWIVSERHDLLMASLSASPYQQMDGTLSKEAGCRMSTQIICGKYHSLFYTSPGRSRLDIYAALQGQSRQTVQLAYTPLAVERMQKAKVSQKHLKWLAQHFVDGAIINLEQLTTFFDTAAIFAKTNKIRLSTITGALAAGYYHQQQAVPIVQLLVTDDGHEYERVANECQMICWIHAIRHYRKLVATIEYHRKILAEKMDHIWNFYDRIKSYQYLTAKEQAAERLIISKRFDTIFGVPTDYEALNRIMVRSMQKKKRLLAFLDHPVLPIHNNMAERGARRVVRKRDISFHTWSSRGTTMRDAFMSLHQTANKLKINFLDYLVKRNGGIAQVKIPHLVKNAYASFSTTL